MNWVSSVAEVRIEVCWYVLMCQWVTSQETWIPQITILLHAVFQYVFQFTFQNEILTTMTVEMFLTTVQPHMSLQADLSSKCLPTDKHTKHFSPHCTISVQWMPFTDQHTQHFSPHCTISVQWMSSHRPTHKALFTTLYRICPVNSFPQTNTQSTFHHTVPYLSSECLPTDQHTKHFSPHCTISVQWMPSHRPKHKAFFTTLYHKTSHNVPTVSERLLTCRTCVWFVGSVNCILWYSRQLI